MKVHQFLPVATYLVCMLLWPGGVAVRVAAESEPSRLGSLVVGNAVPGGEELKSRLVGRS